MDSPGKNTWVGYHALLQWVFPTWGSNLCLLALPALVGGFFTTSDTWEMQRLPAAAAAAKSLQSCPTLCDPTDGQPTRLPRPWDSPGKNTGVGCHFLLQCMKVKSESEVAQLCPTPSDPMDCSLPGSSVHGIFQARVLEWVAIAFSEQMLRCCRCCWSGPPHPHSENHWVRVAVWQATTTYQ